MSRRGKSVPCKEILLPNFGVAEEVVLEGCFAPAWGVKWGKVMGLQGGAGVAQGNGSGALRLLSHLLQPAQGGSQGQLWMCRGVSSHTGVFEPSWLGWMLRLGGAAPLPTHTGGLLCTAVPALASGLFCLLPSVWLFGFGC